MIHLRPGGQRPPLPALCAAAKGILTGRRVLACTGDCFVGSEVEVITIGEPPGGEESCDTSSSSDGGGSSDGNDYGLSENALNRPVELVQMRLLLCVPMHPEQGEGPSISSGKYSTAIWDQCAHECERRHAYNNTCIQQEAVAGLRHRIVMEASKGPVRWFEVPCSHLTHSHTSKDTLIKSAVPGRAL